MQGITPALEALLKAKFQAGASGFRARLEIVTLPPPCVSPIIVPGGESDLGGAICPYVPGSVRIGVNGATPTTTDVIEVDPAAGQIAYSASTGESDVVAVYFEPVPATGSTTVIEGEFHISIDKSLRMQADQATVDLVNEGLPLGWGTGGIARTNSLISIFQWYGDSANAVQTFTGVIDKVLSRRDVLATSFTCRDRMALLIDPKFSTSAPQKVGEPDAVRNPANGVYLSMEVSDIVADIADRAGWPTADRAITPTSYVLDEYVVPDGSSWAEAIIGQDKLTGVTGYDLWADELGVLHFAPTAATDIATAPPDPVYTFRAGVDILSLDDSLDQYELRTRVKIRGPLITTTLADAWTEKWRTSKVHLPVGLWYAPDEPGWIRVIDRGTKKLYVLRQSDRAVLSSVYLGGVIAHPLGLSGDPSDATIYWVLNAPWIDGGSGGNSVKKVRRSDNHVLASYALPAGRWSALKVSAAHLWLTNLDTDRFYSRSKADASAVADYRHTYGSVLQSNPSGMMVDGTTLYLFWSNAGTTARFLVANESAPGTVIKAVKTAGTALHGGEMDTTTHVDCYGDSDSLGLVAKFTLVVPVVNAKDVAVEVVDIELEDELGALAAMQDRTHDAHPDAPMHAFEVRRETIDLKLITSVAQGTETARLWLAKLGKRRRTVDAGIIGNPALQKGDYVRVEDPVTGLAEQFIIDTYHADMAADGTYLGTVALLPTTVSTDVITDLGAAT